jgi:hypothetical protein
MLLTLLALQGAQLTLSHCPAGCRALAPACLSHIYPGQDSGQGPDLAWDG